MHTRILAVLSILAAAAPARADDPVDEAAAPAVPAAPATSAPAPAPRAVSPGRPAPRSAAGEPAPRAATEVRAFGGSADPRSYANDWLVAPPGWNLGGEMRFITADSAPTGERIKLTDLALLRLRARWTTTRRLELSASADVLAKQLDTTHEPLLQGGSLGAKLATSRTLALAAGVSGGPALGSGWWGDASVGVVHRSQIESFIAFQVGAGGLATMVNARGTPRKWQADATGAAELTFHTPHGEWALWFGTELALPVVHADSIAPSSRLDLTIGTVYSAVRDWDLYVEYTFRDRGTTKMPETTLPIIDGGFDQRQLVVGITRRFARKRGASRWVIAQ
jgi:hypothetical protein